MRLASSRATTRASSIDDRLALVLVTRARARTHTMDPQTGLPYGWNERTNAMSDMSGVAARSFSARGAYGEEDGAYKTSEQVSEYWMKRIESERAEGREDAGESTDGASGMASIDWERRARVRASEAERYGVGGATLASGQPAGQPAAVSAPTSCSPELALVRLATQACESVAAVLETRLVSLPEEDRAAFAAALKRSSERVFKCR